MSEIDEDIEYIILQVLIKHYEEAPMGIHNLVVAAKDVREALEREGYLTPGME